MKTVSKRALTIDHIEKIYQRYQHRSATNDELATHLSQEDSVGRVLSYLLPRSKKNRPPRVLLFGAFGNGNIGDAYQAMAVRSHLKKSWGLNDDAIFACSLLSNTAYPFPKENKLPSSSIFDYELVNSFDCLIVGGGGLLAHPHEPLFDAAWTQRIDVPIVLLSIGASTSNVHAHSQLLENALLVSGRDSESLDALKLLRADALLIPDPILSVEEIQSLTELDELPSSAPGDIDVLWILKYPSNDFDINILRWIARYISDDVSRKHVIVAIEPRIDIALGEYFPNESISYFYDLAGLHKNIEKSRFVFSMRYHGAIFSIMASKPVFGFSQKKIKALFDEAGLYGGYLESVRDLEKVLSSLDAIMPRSNKNLSSCQKRFSDAFMLVGADFTSLYDEEATDKCH
jgi:polysaccharide pyruvyl transferase WcaK-like protein